MEVDGSTDGTPRREVFENNFFARVIARIYTMVVSQTAVERFLLLRGDPRLRNVLCKGTKH
jgi:hypothetical protein